MKLPTYMKPYKVKVPRTQRVAPARQGDSVDGKEVMTGVVMGQPASDLEERAYRSFVKIPSILGIEFQPSYLAGRGMPGEYRLDFLIHMAGYSQPIQIDGNWIHKSAEAHESDRQKDAVFDNHMIGTGALPVRRVNELEMPDQVHSDQLFSEMLR